MALCIELKAPTIESVIHAIAVNDLLLKAMAVCENEANDEETSDTVKGM